MDQKQVEPVERMALNNWTLSGQDTLTDILARVPGTVHLDLLAAGVIEDPFRDNNALQLDWIEDQDWTYTSTFTLSNTALERDAINLVLEGVDTYATVELNGQVVSETNNMFRHWRIPAKPFLKSGENTLRVLIHAPVPRHRRAADSLGFVYPADNDLSKTAPFVRKAAYHFGWDWAPRMVTCGIWKPAYLELRDAARIDAVRLEQRVLSDSIAVIDVTVEIERYAGRTITLMAQGEPLALEGHTATGQIRIRNPKRWWPNGSGDQNLYAINIALRADGQTVDQWQRQIGLRTVELVNAPDSIGTSFYFKINGQPLFMKGANYIPQDVFLPRVQPAQYRKLLIAAKEANMNMLRVWGGGIYERDLFYNLCDSLGLLVWQDFMFAGTMYPGDSAFIRNVETEAREQVQRLRHHPCLALWCGNNEIDVAWHNWGWQEKYNYTAEDSAQMWHDYLHLFGDVLPGIVAEAAPDIPYVGTSPQSNWGTPQNFNHGSMHYWGVWHGRAPARSFRDNVGRFMVEYGMQSYPDISTLENYISSQHLQLDSPVMQRRQKSYIGNGEIERHIRDLGLEPQTFAEFTTASQQAQARALEIAIDAHRHSDGHCMGSLVWQLNDCWPGPSWSIIDYNGRKKLAYHTVQRGFTDKP